MVWGKYKATDVELFHIKVMRRVLRAKMSVNLLALYREIEKKVCYPVCILQNNNV